MMKLHLARTGEEIAIDADVIAWVSEHKKGTQLALKVDPTRSIDVIESYPKVMKQIKVHTR